jgi:hypothetical protein
MKKISFRKIFSVFIASFAMVASSYAYAGKFGDMLNDYMVGRQLNNKQVNPAANGVMEALGNGQVRLRGIELTPEWQQIFRMAQDATQKVDENLINAGQRFDFCANPNILRQMTENPKSFDYNYNSKLPRQASNPSKTFDYSTVMELNRFNRNFTGVEAVQIPNANAISTVLNYRDDNISQNASAMMLPHVLAVEIRRQYVANGRNPTVDSRDMYTATLRDIATIGYLIVKNPQLNVSFDDFFITSMTVYARNKVLCLYDAPIGYNIPF